jgi:hypothetical protein
MFVYLRISVAFILIFFAANISAADYCEPSSWDEYENKSTVSTTAGGWSPVLTVDSLLVSRLEGGLYKYFVRKNGWAQCGKIVRNKEEIAKLAKYYAYTINIAIVEQSNEDYAINMWGVVGVMLQESGLDPCAVGKNPREYAYTKGILKRPEMGITHTVDELKRALKNPAMMRRFKRTGYDLGLAQMLQPYYDAPNDYDKIFNPVYSANQTVKEMIRRSRRMKTKKPWLYWRGHKAHWYENRIKKQAKRAGAIPGEL